MGLSPSPGNAAQIAEMILPWVQANYGTALDYSPTSLGQVDVIIDDLRRDQRFEAVQTLLFSMGCYVGEVLVRNTGARWCTPQELGLATVASSPIVVAMPDGRNCNPVGRAYRRFQNGRVDDVAGFYQAMAEPPPGKLPP